MSDPSAVETRTPCRPRPPTEDAGRPPKASADAGAADASPDRLAVARARYERGDLVEAEAACRDVLAARPADPEALHLLGQIMRRLGCHAIAAALIAKAIDGCSTGTRLHVSLGRVLREMGKLDAAMASCRRALELAPNDAAANREFGTVLFDVRDLDGAAKYLRRALTIRPADAEAHFRLANTLLELGDHAAAAASFRHAVELDAGYARRHYFYAVMHQGAGNFGAADTLLDWGLMLNPGDPELTFLAAAMRGTHDGARAPDVFVVKHFDAFAESFDDLLTGRLKYRTPELLVERIRQTVDPRPDSLAVLDAGCGTGLCGPLLRPLAERLVGVDLSPLMLKKARARGVYDELRCAELTAFLDDSPETHDLIAAADVLVYFGDLSAVLDAAARSLRPGGHVAFSVELHDGPGYLLQSCARYAHGRAYLGEAAAAAGLTMVDVSECDLRLESDRPVRGLLLVLGKPAASTAPSRRA